MSSELPATKGRKVKQALKVAAMLPVRVTSITFGRGTGRNNLTLRPGEPAVVIFRLQVIYWQKIVEEPAIRELFIILFSKFLSSSVLDS